jgi:hypothetical protein
MKISAELTTIRLSMETPEKSNVYVYFIYNAYLIISLFTESQLEAIANSFYLNFFFIIFMTKAQTFVQFTRKYNI